jgi:pentose-5-phosphate-3-epimerase
MTWREWIRTVEIVPAIGHEDATALPGQVEALLRTGCRIFHLQVHDDLAALETATLLEPMLRRYDGVLDVQLDGAGSADVFAAVADAGAASVIFQLEASVDPAATIEAAHAAGLEAGVAFAPGTDAGAAARAAAGAELVRCPGSVLDDQLRDVEMVAQRLPPGFPVMVGGGLTHENVRELYDAGASVLLVGGAIFDREDLPRAYRRLVQALA